jgi:glycosyltransferase involved in cell wall biosynthesis
VQPKNRRRRKYILKVVVLGTRGFPDVQGGVERHCEELYPRLVKLGCDVTVFTRTPYITEESRVEEWAGVKFVHLWCPRKKSIEALVHTFLGVLRSKRIAPDILHIHSIGPSLLIPMAKLLGLKVVMTHHGPDYERAKWGKMARLVLRQGEKLGVLYSSNTIAISNGIKDHIKTNYSRDAAFIPNGVSIPSLIPPGEELAKWQLEPQKYVFTACRFVPEKGLHDLVNAYRNINKPPFKLVIAGDADHETAYSRKLKGLASETEGVILTGFLSGKRLGELFTNAGLFVLPSYYEGLPIALLEALSYGLPVLVSDIPQHKEVPLGDFRYFHSGDISNLSEALTESFYRGIADSEKEETMSLIKKNYRWDDIAERTLDVYRQLINI